VCGALLVILIMTDYASGIEVWSDGEVEREEINYNLRIRQVTY